jgi:general secretion pathway protein A
MYTKYFGLTEQPFSIAANPRFLYMSTRHREALAHLLYGIRSDSGFVLLTGEVGTGKTTVCRCLLEQLPENTSVAFILNPRVSVNEMLSSICDELGIKYPEHDCSGKTFVDAINRHLLDHHAEGRNTVVIIDEAQNLSVEVLEQLRLLTNLETNERKLMRIFLLGQPELVAMLSRPELRQVEQRITARYHLQPLLRTEIEAYVIHRLAVAGCRESVFSARVLSKLFNKTGGIPRLINVICDRAMLGAYVKSKRKVSGWILNKAAMEVQGRSHQPRNLLRGSIVAFAMLVAVTATAALFYTNGREFAMMLPLQSVEPLPDLDLVDKPVIVVLPEASPRVPQTSPLWPVAVAARDGTFDAAYIAQFKQWDIALVPGGADPCTQAISRGLRCFSEVGNLASLASNNRPAILTLVDNQGRPYQATLLALNDELATLAFAHGIETVAVKDLEARWQGHYQLMWRTSPQGLTIIRPDSRGPDVTWLTENLLAAGISSVSLQNVYDANVDAAVRTFQRKHGLVADGIAGRQTLLQLNSENDKSIPRLSNPRGN